MTNGELIEILSSYPKDMPVLVYRGSAYLPIEQVLKKKLWSMHNQVESITIHTDARWDKKF